MGPQPLFFYLVDFTKNAIFQNQDFRLNVTHSDTAWSHINYVNHCIKFTHCQGGDSQKFLFFLIYFAI